MNVRLEKERERKESTKSMKGGEIGRKEKEKMEEEEGEGRNQGRGKKERKKSNGESQFQKKQKISIYMPGFSYDVPT